MSTQNIDPGDSKQRVSDIIGDGLDKTGTGVDITVL